MIRDHLAIDHLSLAFGGLVVLRDVSLTAATGSVTALIGPNGAGKSSLLNCISGLYRPQQGRICWEGCDLTGLGPHRLAALGVGRTFQHAECFPELTVLDNLLVGYHTGYGAGGLAEVLRLPGYRRDDARARSRAAALLDYLELRPLAHRPVADLPFVFQKLTDLGRALMASPRLLLMDEPAAGMGAADKQAFTRLVARQRADDSLTLLLVEHDVNLVMSLADDIYVMNFGEIIAHGPPTEVRISPAVRSAYLGADADADAGAPHLTH